MSPRRPQPCSLIRNRPRPVRSLGRIRELAGGSQLLGLGALLSCGLSGSSSFYFPFSACLLLSEQLAVSAAEAPSWAIKAARLSSFPPPRLSTQSHLAADSAGLQCQQSSDVSNRESFLRRADSSMGRQTPVLTCGSGGRGTRAVSRARAQGRPACPPRARPSWAWALAAPGAALAPPRGPWALPQLS